MPASLGSVALLLSLPAHIIALHAAGLRSSATKVEESAAQNRLLTKTQSTGPAHIGASHAAELRSKATMVEESAVQNQLMTRPHRTGPAHIGASHAAELRSKATKVEESALENRLLTKTQSTGPAHIGASHAAELRSNATKLEESALQSRLLTKPYRTGPAPIGASHEAKLRSNTTKVEESALQNRLLTKTHRTGLTLISASHSAELRSNATKVEKSALQSRLLTTTHRTGTALATQTAKCLRLANISLDIATHGAKGPTIDEYDKAVIFVRNPFTTVVSRYLYHRSTGEKWTMAPGTALSVLTVWSDCLPEYPLVPQESYTDLLRRLPWQAGLLTELCFFQAHGYKQMKRSRKECVKRSGKCTTFCVERFMEGSDQFLQSWTKVFNFLGISRPTPGTPAYDCIRLADLTRPDFTGGKRHGTINKNLIAGVDRKRMEQYVRKEDAVQSMLRLGGQWRSLAFLERRVKCG